MSPSVCILTAGTGRRTGPFADIINKCLLPYNGQAIISHLIDRFPPNTRFVIALGYKAEQVQIYLTLMHPERDFTFVTVDRYTGPGTGPAYSLSCCRDALPGPFYFIAGDGFFETIPTDTGKNWVGLSAAQEENAEAYCNIAYATDTHRALAVYDKMTPPKEAHTGIFNGLMFIKDTAPFWASLEAGAPTAGELQIAQGFTTLIKNGALYGQPLAWRDLGTFELYKNALEDAFDFSKMDEFIYISAKRVVKFFANATISEQRVKKAALLPGVFPAIKGSQGQFYAYDKAPGKTAYDMLDAQLVGKLLPWLKHSLWKPHATAPERMEQLCRTFYYDKTQQRVALYKKKYPDVTEPAFVNGQPVLPIAALLQKLPASLIKGVPAFIHGDLQFDNIITDGERFTLIDWRQDFAGEVAFGDWYYDLAKLLGGIYLNYDYIKHGLMRFHQQGNAAWYDFAVRDQAPAYAAQLRTFVEAEGLDFTRVEIIRGIIYLNMAPLHHPPFDRLLHALAQATLTRALT